MKYIILLFINCDCPNNYVKEYTLSEKKKKEEEENSVERGGGGHTNS